MAFIVTEPCINCKHTTCVDVCPMECFVEGPNFLAIDPDGCISCSICVPECPEGAIVDADEADEAQRPYIALNARLAADPRWVPIRRSREAMATHEAWSGVAEKRHLLL